MESIEYLAPDGREEGAYYTDDWRRKLMKLVQIDVFVEMEDDVNLATNEALQELVETFETVYPFKVRLIRIKEIGKNIPVQTHLEHETRQ